MCGRAFWYLFALAVVCGMMPVGSASAASLFELNFWLSGPRYDGVLPACDEQAPLDTIANPLVSSPRFAIAMA